MKLNDLLDNLPVTLLHVHEQISAYEPVQDPTPAQLKLLARRNKYRSARFVIYKPDREGHTHWVAADSEHFTHHSMAPAMGSWLLKGYVDYVGDGEYAYRSMEVYSPKTVYHSLLKTWEQAGIQDGNPDRSNWNPVYEHVTPKTDNQTLSQMVARDQTERNEYQQFVKTKAGGDWHMGAKMYAAFKNRRQDDVFGERSGLQKFMSMQFDFDQFTQTDWDNYWLLSQHCDFNRTFQKQALSIITKYLGTEHSHYRYLYDRISCGTSGTQKYGTQDICGKDDTATESQQLQESLINNIHGWGKVPNNQNVDYLGMRVSMKPSMFLKLAAPLERANASSVQDMVQHLRTGGTVASPWLVIRIPEAWEEGDYDQAARVTSHEGRNRMYAIQEVQGDEPVEVHVFFASGLRARHIKPDWVRHMMHELIPQHASSAQSGNWFQPMNQQMEESAIDLSQGGRAVKDLRVESVVKMARKQPVRGLVFGRHIYWWPAANATHGEVAAQLGFTDYVDYRLMLSKENGELRLRGHPVEIPQWLHHVKLCPQLNKLTQSDQLYFHAGGHGWVSGPEFAELVRDETTTHMSEAALVKLGPQLYVPHPGKLKEGLKPEAKLWTSTAHKSDAGYTSAWAEWCSHAMPAWLATQGTLYDVKPGARILTINTDRQARAIAKKYGVQMTNVISLLRLMPWDRISQDYDAVHHVPSGDRLSNLLMGTWDVESTAWFNTNFLTNPRKVEIHTQDTPLAEAPIRATLYTDPSYYGASVQVPKKIQEPVVLLPTNKIDVFEPDAKFNNPKHAANLERIKAAILKGVKLPAILVRRVGQKYQVVDGHHRFKAYRNLNIKQIPARIVKSQNIAVVDKSSSPVDEAWSKKYKKSINCNNPKGFSQRAHCAGRKARSSHRKTKSASVSEATNPSNTAHDMDQIATHYSELYDQILTVLCDMIDYQNTHNPKKYGEVGAAIVDPDSRIVVGFSTSSNGKWRHAEYNAIVAYNKKYGAIPAGSVVITTCSPCSARMPDRHGVSCTHRINEQPIPLVYCGFEDPTQHTHLHNFKMVITQNTHIHDRCKKHAQRFLDWELEQKTQAHPDSHSAAALKANQP